MKPLAKLPALLFFLIVHTQLFAQDCPEAKSFKKHRFKNASELSLGAGVSHYFGDLSPANMTDKRVMGEIHKEHIQPALSLDYRYYFTKFLNLRTSVLYCRLRGSDKYNEVEDEFSSSWYRQYRNLTFRTDLLQLAVLLELNLFGFEPGGFKRKFSPYILGGAGMIYFDPKGPYNEDWVNLQSGDAVATLSASKTTEKYPYNKWVRLQPLGTEGQGMPGYAAKYSLVEPVLLVGLGFKCKLSEAVTVGIELTHQFTFTDYLDDVSTSYPDPQDYYKYYDPEHARLAASMSVRSKELDPSGVNSYITSTGQQRGSPKYNDSYMISVITVGYNLTRKYTNTKPPKRKKKGKEENDQNSPDKMPKYLEKTIKTKWGTRKI